MKNNIIDEWAKHPLAQGSIEHIYYEEFGEFNISGIRDRIIAYERCDDLTDREKSYLKILKDLFSELNQKRT